MAHGWGEHMGTGCRWGGEGDGEEEKGMGGEGDAVSFQPPFHPLLDHMAIAASAFPI